MKHFKNIPNRLIFILILQNFTFQGIGLNLNYFLRQLNIFLNLPQTRIDNFI
jgi:hypothetical protein